MATRLFNVFVEGTDDHDLILALINEIKTVKPHPNRPSLRQGGEVTTYLELVPTGDTLLISSTGGWSKLGRKQANFIQEARDFGGKTLVIFDADFDIPEYESGGYLLRKASLLEKLRPFDPNPEIFLFPQLGEDGDLETLLLQLTQPQHQRVMVCYDGYEACLRQYKNNAGEPYYDAPSKKRRVYDYVNVMRLKDDQWERHHKKGGQKIFDNSDLWDLTAPAIQPLREFLNQHIP